MSELISQSTMTPLQKALNGVNIKSIDLGYGNTKLAGARTEFKHEIPAMLFPSRSIVAKDKDLSMGMTKGSDTIKVRVGDIDYLVGKDIVKEQGTYEESQQLNDDYSASAPYMARMLGAFHYMIKMDPKPLQDHVYTIDYLMLGLPVSTYRMKGVKEALAERMTGEFTIPGGITVKVKKAIVMAQPTGAFMEYAIKNNMLETVNEQTSLIVDVGYLTFDWLTSNGMKPNGTRSDSAKYGMHAVIQAIAEESKRVEGWGKADVDMLVRILDGHYRDGRPYNVYGKDYDVSKYKHAAFPIINDAVAKLWKSVGDGIDIQNIVMAGGGAALFKEVMEEKYPHHDIHLLDDPVFSNVRGFQLYGEVQVMGMNRALRKETVNA